MTASNPSLTHAEAEAAIKKYGSIRAAAAAMGTNFYQVHRALRPEFYNPTAEAEEIEPTPPAPETVEEQCTRLGLELARANTELSAVKGVNTRVQKQLVIARARTEDLVQAVWDGAKDAALSLGPIGPTPMPPIDPRRERRAEVALWHMTDWQGSKVTTSYNSEVMIERVNRFIVKARGITEIQRADHPVRKCLIAFGGDMVEGLFNFPTQPFEVDLTIFGQFVKVSKLIVETIQQALSIYEEVEVVSEWGNHGRMGGKRDAVPRHDNIDRMTYELARQLLVGEPRVTWDAAHGTEDIQRIEIGNYRALLIHGDEIGRNGFSSPMTLLRAANQWRSGAYPWEFRDVYVGHYHNHAEWAMANGMGTLYQTGSIESDNRYARETMAASALPSQRLHFIDPEEGRVAAQYKIYVSDTADQGGL